MIIAQRIQCILVLVSIVVTMPTAFADEPKQAAIGAEYLESVHEGDRYVYQGFTPKAEFRGSFYERLTGHPSFKEAQYPQDYDKEDIQMEIVKVQREGGVTNVDARCTLVDDPAQGYNMSLAIGLNERVVKFHPLDGAFLLSEAGFPRAFEQYPPWSVLSTDGDAFYRENMALNELEAYTLAADKDKATLIVTVQVFKFLSAKDLESAKIVPDGYYSMARHMLLTERPEEPEEKELRAVALSFTQLQTWKSGHLWYSEMTQKKKGGTIVLICKLLETAPPMEPQGNDVEP